MKAVANALHELSQDIRSTFKEPSRDGLTVRTTREASSLAERVDALAAVLERASTAQRDQFAGHVLMGTIANGSLGRLINQLGESAHRNQIEREPGSNAVVAPEPSYRIADIEAHAKRQIAEACYEMAGAMLVARDRKDGE